MDNPWLVAPALYQGPLDGSPAAGDAVLANSVPAVPLVFGEIAGRPLVATVTDTAWLARLEDEARTARERLSAMTFPGPQGRAA